MSWSRCRYRKFDPSGRWRRIGARRRIVTTGDPAAEVLQTAIRLGIDLIVMATHGPRGARRLVRITRCTGTKHFGASIWRIRASVRHLKF
jgi:hypothetical protein